MPETDQSVQPDKELALLRDAAAEAGRIAMRYFGRDPEVWFKDGHSPVSEADLAVDQFLKKTLLEARPDYGWISEETQDDREIAPRRRSFVVDPIDGTRSYIAGKDQWCISIAIIENGRPLAGVLECPVRSETIEAVLGGGARQNGQDIAVASPAPDEILSIALSRSTLDTLPEGLRGRVVAHPYISSLAYRIAMVARGEIAGTFIRPNSHDWDLAAADLILGEAGGAIRVPNGPDGLTGSLLQYGGPTRKHGALVASSGDLLQQMLSVVAKHPLG